MKNFCPDCKKEVNVVENKSVSLGVIILIILGLIVPLWPITLPLFWFMAYRGYKKNIQRLCFNCGYSFK